jgi:serine/threonine-protein kinase
MRKLLGDFVSICQAMEYVHSRGVVHRDLKPGNIMLGEFGEVHVIDWGVAKIADAPEPIQASSPRITMDSANLDNKATAAGAIIGTLGYMPPEQLQGMHELVDGRSDIYSLGAILFEILTLEPLHSRNSPVTTAASTLTGANARARQRAPNRDIAPELEDICIKASQLDQDARYTGVREMIDELSRYLDGDRDLARRKALASEHGQNARELAREALEGTGKSSDAARKQALREAGRALALDPTQEEAVDILTQLMLEPPRHMPLEVEASLKATQQQENRQKMELAVYTYLLLFGFFPLLVWMGVTRPSIIWAQAGVLAVMTGVSYAVMRSKEIKPWMIFVGMMFNVAFVLVLTRIFSLFIVAPGFMAVNTVAFLFHKNLQKPLITVFMGCLGLILPFIFELTGVFEPTLLFEDGRLIVLSHAIELPRLPTLVTLELTSLALVIGAAVFMHRMWRAQYEIERQVHLQVWQLRQLVPDRAHRRVATAQPDIRKP